MFGYLLKPELLRFSQAHSYMKEKNNSLFSNTGWSLANKRLADSKCAGLE